MLSRGGQPSDLSIRPLVTFSSMCSSSQELGDDGEKVLWPRRGDRARRQEGPGQKPDVGRERLELGRSLLLDSRPQLMSTAERWRHSGNGKVAWRHRLDKQEPEKSQILLDFLLLQSQRPGPSILPALGKGTGDKSPARTSW